MLTLRTLESLAFGQKLRRRQEMGRQGQEPGGQLRERRKGVALHELGRVGHRVRVGMDLVVIICHKLSTAVKLIGFVFSRRWLVMRAQT